MATNAGDDRRRPKRPLKPVANRPLHSMAHLTIWTMSGEPMPGSTMRRLEEAVQRVASDSHTRLLFDLRKL